LSGYIFATKAYVSTIGKKIVKQQYLPYIVYLGCETERLGLGHDYEP